MSRTNNYLIPSIFFCIVFYHPSFCLADDLMPPSVQYQDERTAIVNQQLNMFESSQGSANGVDKQFPNLQMDSGRGSSSTRSDGASAGDMLKDLLKQGLSDNPHQRVASRIKPRVNTLDLGSEIFYYRYVEQSTKLVQNNEIVDVKDVGPMYGFYANYDYRPAAPSILNNPLMNVYSLQARYAFSHNIAFSGEGNVNKVDDAQEYRGLIGKDYYIGRDSMVTPYFGFGYRYLFNKGDGQLTSLNYLSEDEKSQYYYLPLGTNIDIAMQNDWEIDLNGEYDILIQGFQKSYFSDWEQFIGGVYPDEVFAQDHGFGMRFSFKILKHCPGVDFYMEPYFRFWNIDQSESQQVVSNGTATAIVEPRNTTVEIGTKFGVQF